MPGPELDEVWRALADPTRRRLLDVLRDRPQTTGQLCQPFEVSRIAIIKHLRVLESAGLVLVRRRGREKWHYLNAIPIRHIYERWVSGYASHWAESLVRLKSLLETRETGMQAGEGGTAREFQIEQEVRIEAPRERVFASLTRDVDQWWGHRFGENTTVRLDPVVGGKFFEDFGDGQGALWGTVTYVKAPDVLRLAGTLGMLDRPVTSVYSFQLEEQAGGTLLKLLHRATGDLDPAWLASYSGGWSQLLSTNLKGWIERQKTWRAQESEG